MENKLKQASEIIEKLLDTINWLGWNSYEMEAISEDLDKAHDFLVSLWVRKSEEELKREEEEKRNKALEQSCKDRIKNITNSKIFLNRKDGKSLHFWNNIYGALQHFWNVWYSQIERIDKNSELIKTSILNILNSIEEKYLIEKLFSVLNSNIKFIDFYDNYKQNSSVKKLCILLLKLNKEERVNLIKNNY